jgi:hypothetical protein
MPPSPPPPDPIMQLPLVQQAEQTFIEDPRPTKIEEMLPPIARAAAMVRILGEKCEYFCHFSMNKSENWPMMQAARLMLNRSNKWREIVF